MLEAETKKPTEVGFFSERFRCLFGCAGPQRTLEARPHPRQRNPEFHLINCLGGSRSLDGSHHRHAKAKVLLAEAKPDTSRLQQIVQFLGGSLAVNPCVAEEAVPQGLA
jgi:hypothetical protein